MPQQGHLEGNLGLGVVQEEDSEERSVSSPSPRVSSESNAGGTGDGTPPPPPPPPTTTLGEDYQPFKQTERYYRGKAGAAFHKVQVTTLIVHAEDDPVVSAAHTDWDKVIFHFHV